MVYEWLPAFCSHCQNIGHDVTECKRLYPRNETVAPKEKAAPKEITTMGKKPIQAAKATWVPRTENPSRIGSSLAFGAVTTILPEPVTAEVAIEELDETQNCQDISGQQARDTNTTPLQTETVLNQAHAVHVPEDVHEAQVQADHEVTQVRTPSAPSAPQPASPLITTSYSPVIHTTTFSMPIENVSDEVITNALERNHVPILSPVKKTNLDISSIVATDDAQMDPVLSQDINFMKTWLAKAAASEEPFKEVVSKSQKKKEFTEGYSQNPLKGSSSPV